jgi:hypothetical protein
MGFHATGSSFRARPTFSSPSASSPPPFNLAFVPLSPGYNRSPRSGTLDAFLQHDISKNLVLPILHGLCLSLLGVHQQDTTGPQARGRPSFVPGCSLTLDGPTTCLTLTHRTRQTISRHSPSPTSHDTSTSRGRLFISHLPECSSTHEHDRQAVPEAPNILQGRLALLGLAHTHR